MMTPYLAIRAIISARRAVFTDWCPASLDTMSVSAKFTRLLLCGASAQALNLIASRAAKSRSWAKKAPDKILRRKIKSDPHKLAQKPDFEAKFSARLFKKAAI